MQLGLDSMVTPKKVRSLPYLFVEQRSGFFARVNFFPEAKNLAEQDRLHQKLKTYDFWTLDLVENIYTVVMRAAWYAANKAKGYPDANDDLDVVNK